ncbi:MULTISPECIES: capsular biosynthesis protein [unclassified Gilliamella]|uniref:capsular biosynthesis protein n=1 Tax=unclassified Gilliamella TaxID=2685620 RepID=UPI0013298BD9|nr:MULTISPECIES: capsular biosynthesis protein [unclassified Gilliamella]MWN31257.1 capsular biosynthesis protein [Gilliamella sp. Pra-s60]MWP29896.1 capsular biosynthesis protein [Gilliamella sp. Pra-s54]
MIIIPMAGLSSRFFKAGFDQPKYKLIAHGHSLFEWSVKSFEKYYNTEKFLFICRDVFDTPQFLEQELKKIGINDFEIATLNRETRGQAETIYLNLDKVPENEKMLIFNIDTYRKDFEFYDVNCDGYLEVFKGDGEHWSFILPEENTDKVLKTTEKDRISDLCSNGIYFFKNKKIYEYAYNNSINHMVGEIYIAPLFNNLIKNNYDIRYRLVNINNHTFMGTPAEYDLFIKNGNSRN